ncbi:hypothetical protein [Photobacterium leiognathi]|uniref:hypothetical protein n=1 Tax=Photobacterium leiognathi TaxID=553611 RepID=UPI002980AA64|nr:hypothetical protein [Photobacterium leiognathi]
MSYSFTLCQRDPFRHISKNFGKLPTFPKFEINPSSVLANNWIIQEFPLSTLNTGYFSNLSDQGSDINYRSIALLNDKHETVMSLTPIEAESHLFPLENAKGTVVIAGLGLGMITHNLLKKKACKKIFVLEIEQDVIDLFPNCLSKNDRELWQSNIDSGRLKIIKHDITKPFTTDLKRMIGNRVDYLWVDTWNTIGDESALPLTQYLQSQVNASVVDFWTFEFCIAHDLFVKKTALFKLDPITALREWVTESQLPLSIASMSKHKQKLFLDLAIMVLNRSIQQQK